MYICSQNDIYKNVHSGINNIAQMKTNTNTIKSIIHKYELYYIYTTKYYMTMRMNEQTIIMYNHMNTSHKIMLNERCLPEKHIYSRSSMHEFCARIGLQNPSCLSPCSPSSLSTPAALQLLCPHSLVVLKSCSVRSFCHLV